MAKQVTFLHAADLHLGSLLKSAGRMSQELQKMVEEAVYTAFERLVDAALRHEVDFVVLSGDIYDQTERSARAKRQFIAQMDRLNESSVPVYLIYGNHDPLGEQPEFFKYPGNVQVFSSDRVDMFEVSGENGRIKARILGQSYSQPSERRKMHNSYRPPDHDAVNIGLLHTGLNPGYHNYVPCSADELKSNDSIDYWALGHIHQRQIIHHDHPVIAFPGITQGRDMGEPGIGGCFLVQARPRKKARLYFIPASPIAWLSVEIPVKGDESSEEDIVALIMQKGEQIVNNVPEIEVELARDEKIEVEGYIVRWHLTGRGEIHHILEKDEEIAEELLDRLRQEFKDSRPFIWTEDIRFETSSPLVDLENISEEDTVLNTLLQIYSEFENDPETRKQVIDRMGKGWHLQRDPEDVKDRAIPVDDEVCSSLIKKALHLAAQRILEGREGRGSW